MIWPGSALGFDKANQPITYNAADDGSGNAPTLIFGPPGTSKTVGLICTELLDEPGRRSYVVLDPKGEICAITSAYRRRVSDVKIINPYGLLVDQRPDMASDRWNPLGDLEPGIITFGDDAQAKGDALIKTSNHENNPFFPDAARSGATATVMWEARQARLLGVPPSLANVRATLTMDPERLRPIVQQMVDCGDYDIASRAAKFLSDNREIESIKSTVETNTGWMTEPMRNDMMTGTGVDFRDCSRQPTTVYVIIPAEELQAKACYMRLMLSSALRSLYRRGGIPVTLIVEEAFILGYHAEVEQALSVLRGFGSRLTVVFQSYQQIRKLYAETHGLFTAGAMLAFRPADIDTAEMLVKKAGKITRPTLSAADPASPSDFGVRPSWQQQQRERIPLAKMFGMPKGRALVWKPGDEAPRISWVKGYYEIPALNERASPNPYFHGAQAAQPTDTPPAEHHGSAAAFIIALVIIALLVLCLFLR